MVKPWKDELAFSEPMERLRDKRIDNELTLLANLAEREPRLGGAILRVLQQVAIWQERDAANLYVDTIP